MGGNEPRARQVWSGWAAKGGRKQVVGPEGGGAGLNRGVKTNVHPDDEEARFPQTCVGRRRAHPRDNADAVVARDEGQPPAEAAPYTPPRRHVAMSPGAARSGGSGAGRVGGSGALASGAFKRRKGHGQPPCGHATRSNWGWVRAQQVRLPAAGRKRARRQRGWRYRMPCLFAPTGAASMTTSTSPNSSSAGSGCSAHAGARGRGGFAGCEERPGGAC